MLQILQQFNDLQQLFIVSQVEVTEKVDNGNEYQHGDIRIDHASGEKCECWNYSETLDLLVNSFVHVVKKS